MYELKIIGKIFTSQFVTTGPRSHKGWETLPYSMVMSGQHRGSRRT